MQQWRSRLVRGAATTCALGLALAAGAACDDDSGSPPGVVTVIGVWGGEEEEAFLAMVAPFEEETGITVEYTGTRDLNLVLATGVASGVLPDVAALPGPGPMAEFARAEALLPLNDVLDMETYQAETAPALVDFGTVGDQVYGVPIKGAVKGLIWYNTAVYDGAEPASWEELESTADSMASGDTRPWCVGLESGPSSGWPATDWVEDFVIRQSGPDVYDAWVNGEQAWSSPEIREAFEAYLQVVSPDRTHGGPGYVVNTAFGSSGNPLFDDPPGCLFHHQASFMSGFFQDEAGAETGDYDFFQMPDVNPEFSGAITGAADMLGMFNDRTEAQQLLEYLVTAEAQQIWVDLRGDIAANTTVTEYPDEIASRSAELMAGAEVFRFDASDLMPEEMNDAFWRAMLDVTQDPGSLDSVLSDLDGVQEAAYAEEE